MKSNVTNFCKVVFIKFNYIIKYDQINAIKYYILIVVHYVLIGLDIIMI